LRCLGEAAPLGSAIGEVDGRIAFASAGTWHMLDEYPSRRLRFG
jgi:hypothetical protein